MTRPRQRGRIGVAATGVLRRRPVRVAAVYTLVAAAVGSVVTWGIPSLELSWEAQRLAWVLLALGLPVAGLLAWAADANPRNSNVVTPPDGPKAWRRVQEEFFALMDVDTATRAAHLVDLASRNPALAGEVETLLKAHEGDGALEELAERIAAVVPRASAQEKNTAPESETQGASS